MQFIIDNWYIILAVLAILAASGIAVYRYFKLPSEEQIEKVRNWLLWAVTEAERELGGGTGKLKLRQVYDLFVSRFPWLAPVISFQRFAELVDDHTASFNSQSLISGWQSSYCQRRASVRTCTSGISPSS